MTPIGAVIALLLLAPTDPDGPKDPPSPAELAAITERGRNLAGYDAAASAASDAIQAQNPKPGSITGYIARKTEEGWAVAFGRLDETKANYEVAYEATRGKAPDDPFQVRAFDPPKVDSGFYRTAARAIETSLKDFVDHFEGQRRPYNVAVLPAEAGQVWVYLVPAQTKPGVWPLGGDARYLVSKDGAEIREKRRLHKAVIEKEPPDDKTLKQVAGVHNHVLAETPEDTDVFHVLVRKPAVPEMIVSERFVFMIEPDGSARFVGKSEDVLKPK